MLKKKLLSSYTIPTIKAINSITSKRFPETLPVGSFVYRIQQYPGDIDIREEIIADPSLDGLSQLIRDIREIIEQVLNDRNSYFADFKAGVDPAFDIRLTPYDSRRIIGQLHILLENNILDEKTFETMREVLPPSPTEQQKNIMEALLRSNYILRWTPAEVLAGFKYLPGDRRKEFRQAIQEPEIVKIDTWSWLNDRFVELSNFLLLFIGSQRVNDEQGDYIDAMKHDVHKYLSEFFFNPFKAFKRMWVLAVAFGDTKMIEKINPLINSGVSIVYQVVSDLKALKDMVKGLPNIPYAQMAREAQAMKTRLSKVYDLEINDSVYGLLNELQELFGDVSYGDERKKGPVLDMIHVLIMKLVSIMNNGAMAYAKKAHLLPVRRPYLEK